MQIKYRVPFSTSCNKRQTFIINVPTKMKMWRVVIMYDVTILISLNLSLVDTCSNKTFNELIKHHTNNGYNQIYIKCVFSTKWQMKWKYEKNVLYKTLHHINRNKISFTYKWLNHNIGLILKNSVLCAILTYFHWI